ncbi:hypothetical protein GCM10017673_38670 [Streptosporangium violaceochromogenes]|nr:hypothetical protein GCM10017673_38670 [Streptosporangium violaceochromogenes]
MLDKILAETRPATGLFKTLSALPGACPAPSAPARRGARVGVAALALAGVLTGCASADGGTDGPRAECAPAGETSPTPPEPVATYNEWAQLGDC